MKKIIFLLLILFINVRGQVELVSESLNKNKYILKYKYSSGNFRLINKNGKNEISFKNKFDESKPNKSYLPIYDLYIAIPTASNPEINILDIDKDYLNAVPVNNPSVRLMNDSTLSYQYAGSGTKLIFPPFYEIKGTFIYNNNYYLHLAINLFGFEGSRNSLFVVKEFTIELTFDKIIPQNIAVFKDEKSVLINNTTSAENILSAKKNNINDSDTWINYNSTYLKIGTAKEGIYRITQSDLVNSLISLNQIDPRNFKLFLRGKEIPIYVEGESDGTFDKNDFIEFPGERNLGGKHRIVNSYNEPYNEYLDRYSDTTVYWLTWNDGKGKRVEIINQNKYILVADTLKYYNEILHYEKNNWFDFSFSNQVEREMPNWTSNKTWIEGNINIGLRSVNFTLNDIYRNKPVYVYAKLMDYASDISQKSHLVSISLNKEIPQDSSYINKYEQRVLKGVYNSTVLTEGTNTINLFSYSTQASINTCAGDWYEIEYPRILKAVNDTCDFRFPYLTKVGVYAVSITGFISNQISIWKFGKDYSKYLINQVDGKILIKDSINADSKFTAFSINKILKPIFYYSKKFVRLRSSNNSADYIAITNVKFIKKTNEYVKFINSNYNKRTIVIDVNDIYDEYAFGFFNPESIKDFLKSTNTYWRPPYPSDVVLIGAATYDYHHNKTIFMNISPTYNYVPSFGAPVSDNWFVNWDTTGAYIPQMNVGRLPINSEMELDYFLAKHKSYVSQQYDKWNKKYLFFSGGNGDDKAQLDQLKSVNDQIINETVTKSPIGGNTFHFYKTINPQTNFGPFTQVQVQNAIDEGAIAISYLGHSGTRTWDNSITEISQLNNRVNRNPLITDFGCSTAKFAEPDIVSFSQLFVTSIGGNAIAYIGNSSIGFTSSTLVYPQLFYQQLLTKSLNIGEAHKNAKFDMISKYGNNGVFKLFSLTNTLIGDPITSLQLPPKLNLSIDKNDITYQPAFPSDNLDSFSIKIRFHNYGSVINDSVEILVIDKINNSINYSIYTKRIIPNYVDSVIVNIPINKKSGMHELFISLDPDRKLQELSLTDNVAEFYVNVASSSIKNLLFYSIENMNRDVLELLNPSTKPPVNKFTYDLSDNKLFINPITKEVPLDTFFTKLSLKNITPNKRYWFRTKLSDENTFSLTKSFYLGNENGYYLNDSISFCQSKFQGVKFKNGVALDTTKIKYELLSAGFLDGNTAVISRDEQTLIPESTIRGHHICVVDDKTFKLISYKTFDTAGGIPSVIQSYITFLDTLSSKYLVFFAVANSGEISSKTLKDKIKMFGSKYIDEVGFIGSWLMIGRKGATIGSVKEKYSSSGKGLVKTDTVFYKTNTEGYLTTSVIGPSSEWKSLFIKQSQPENSKIVYNILGIKNNSYVDTLNFLDSLQPYSLTSVDPQKYPRIMLLAKMKSSDSGRSPIISEIKVQYKQLPELGTNYQVVSLVKDTLNQGENTQLKFSVYNVGKSTASNFKVKFELIKKDNSKEKIFEQVVDSIKSENKKQFEVTYNTSAISGNLQFNITIDPDNAITELYKDNNFYSIPFYVKPNSKPASLKLTIDGNDIMNGDFISAKPNIKVELNDESLIAINDTNKVLVYLNNKRIYFTNNSKNISYSFSSSNPKMIVNYNPELKNGDYTLKVVGKNATDQVIDSSGIVRKFSVKNELQLLDAFNYPNPFRDDTYFTFKLTQIPDELKILIFTVAGRKIKEIKVSSSELHYDFNRIYWDGRDSDGDFAANGTYLYKIISQKGSENTEITQKLSIVR